MTTYYLATAATISFLVFINASQGVILEDMGISQDLQGTPHHYTRVIMRCDSFPENCAVAVARFS